MTTHPPRPLAPLVEAWGVRALDGRLLGTMWFNAEQAQRTATAFDGAAVVPLIAADRLTSSEVEHVIACALSGGTYDEFWQPRARAVLAALRAHLEES